MAENTIDPKMLDKRVTQRFIKRGQLNEKEYEKLMKALPDLEKDALPIESTMEATEVTGAGNHPDED